MRVHCLLLQAMVESLLKEYPNVLTLRVRMPIVKDLVYPRNFITKIIKYDKVRGGPRHGFPPFTPRHAPSPSAATHGRAPAVAPAAPAPTRPAEQPLAPSAALPRGRRQARTRPPSARALPCRAARASLR